MEQQLTPALLNAKRNALGRRERSIALLPTEAPYDSLPLVVTPAPFVGYPARAAPAVTVLQYICPSGQRAVINRLAINHWGGGFVDGGGDVIWRVLLNGATVRGMDNLQSQFGTDSQPLKVLIALLEGDTLSVTVETVAVQPAGTTTSARFVGYTVPIIRNKA